MSGGHIGRAVVRRRCSAGTVLPLWYRPECKMDASGCPFQRLLSDIVRVWPGPARSAFNSSRSASPFHWTAFANLAFVCQPRRSLTLSVTFSSSFQCDLAQLAVLPVTTCPRVCACAFASLSLLGPTCVPDQHYQDLSPYWDLI